MNLKRLLSAEPYRRISLPAVEKGIAEGTQAGPLAGYPVVGIHVNLYDGSSHSVDSSEAAFKTAATMALKDAPHESRSCSFWSRSHRFRCVCRRIKLAMLWENSASAVLGSWA